MPGTGMRLFLSNHNSLDSRGTGYHDGETVIGQKCEKWKIVRKIGEGRCCTVYLVHLAGEPNIKKALKVYKQQLNYAAACKREMDIIDHIRRSPISAKPDNIVKVESMFEHRGNLCLLTELLDCNIRDIANRNTYNELRLYTIQKLLHDLIKAIQCVHEAGYVHADVKPANMMWCAQECQLKLFDFSLSFQEGSPVTHQVQTSCYRAPEAHRWNEALKLDAACLSNDDHPNEKSSGTESKSTHNPGEKRGTSVPEDDESVNVAKRARRVKSCSGVGSLTSSPLTKAIDMWSVGCLACELFTGARLFSREQIPDICPACRRSATLDVAESSDCKHKTLPDYHIRLTAGAATNDTLSPEKLTVLSDLRDLVARLLQCRPDQRLTAREALTHRFFKHKITPSSCEMLSLPSTILRLVNIVDEEQLDSDEEYQDVLVDIQEESEKFGPIKICFLPKDGPAKGKAYVHYTFAHHCHKALESLTGRAFNEHTILATFFPIEFWNTHRLF